MSALAFGAMARIQQKLAGGGGGGGGDAEGLVMQIKGLQRSDPGAKEQWWAYCDSMGGGIRDPSKHDAEFLGTFITQFSSGATFEAPAGGGRAGPQVMDANLSSAIKMFQKKSPGFTQIWKMYCQNFGTGMNDPNKHDTQFLTNFLDHLGTAGMMVPPRATIGDGGGMGMGGGPPAKRQRTNGPAKHETEGMIGQNPEKDKCAMRVKNYQKSCEEAKQIWWNFCDSEHKGVRDPMRHSADVLMQFCNEYGVP